MALIIRIDVDRPYGRRPFLRHFLSRLSSDLYFPKVPGFGFLAELEAMLTWLEKASARAYVFFRRCTLPSKSILKLLDAGRHEIGLHLENSRSLTTFIKEMQIVENHVGRHVRAISKHGSGGAKYGFHHYAPYEPERYIEWANVLPCVYFWAIWKTLHLSPRKRRPAYWYSPLRFGSNRPGEIRRSSR